MNTRMLANTEGELAQHLMLLKEYARRVIGRGESLTAGEDSDRARRMAEFLTTGESLTLTEREMVALIYDGIHRNKKECGCHSCRTKESA